MDLAGECIVKSCWLLGPGFELEIAAGAFCYKHHSKQVGTMSANSPTPPVSLAMPYRRNYDDHIARVTCV